MRVNSRKLGLHTGQHLTPFVEVCWVAVYGVSARMKYLARCYTVSPVVNPKVEMFSAQYCTDWSVSMIVPTLQDIVGRGLEYKY
jgi:hypothetical protein